MLLKVLVVDDEPLAREGLRYWLQRDPGVAEIIESSGGHQAIQDIRAYRPDLVFLDVHMPGLNGLEVVRELGGSMPPVVFVTAHDAHAVAAFDLNAIDYLLKPVTHDRFERALARARARLILPAMDAHADRLGGLVRSLETGHGLQRIAVPHPEGTAFVDVEDVSFFRAAQNYVEIHLASKQHLIHTTMNALESTLDPQRFLRIHRSTMVNLSRVQRVRPLLHGEFEIQMNGGTELKSGRSYSARVRAVLAKLRPG